VFEEVPFGLNVSAGVQGLDYERVEAVFSLPPKPHGFFEEYRVIYFADSDGYNVEARTRPFELDTTAVAQFSELFHELTAKY